MKTSRAHTADQTLTKPESFKAGAVEPKGRSRAMRYLRRGLIGLAVVMGIAYFVGPQLAAPFVRRQLQQMVSKNLNATLTMDRLTYRFPYGVKARNVAMVARDEQGRPIDLLRVKELELALAELPLGGGPLVIERIVVREPSAHLIMGERGMVGGRGLVKQDDVTTVEQSGRAKAKPSDHFRLRKFEIRDGAIVFEDRRGGGGRPSVVWKNLGVDLNIEPRQGSLYSWEVAAKNAPLATANVRGRVDVDSAVLDVERFILALRVERGKAQEQLPPMLQEVLRRYEVAGGLSINGRARVPLKDPDSAEYEAVLDLPSGSARVSEGAGRIDRVALKLRVNSEDQAAATAEVERPVTLSPRPPAGTQASTAPAYTRPNRQPPMVVKLDLLEVGTGDTLLHVEKGEAVIDPATQQWRVKDLLCRLDLGGDRSGMPSKVEQALGKMELTGKLRLTATAAGPLRPEPNGRLMNQVEYQVIAYPRDIVVRPPNWPAPFTNVSGTVRANREALIFENVEARFSEDRFFVAGARIPLDDIMRELRINEITGSATLTGMVESYPRPFDFTAKQLHPSGTWHAIGYFARRRGLKPGEKPEFRFDVRTDEGGAAITSRRLPLTEAKAEIVLSPALIEIKRLEANALGGRVTAEGQVTPGRGAALNYQGTGWVRDVDVKSLAAFFSEKGKQPKRLSGKGNVNIQVGGTGAADGRTAADNFAAAGRFEVLEGDFFDLSVVRDVASNAKVKSDATSAGQAAGVFEIRDRVVELKQAAISEPMLGLQGSGRVGFDGRMDLRVVAAPLADWKDQMKRTRIPILSDVAGEVLGALQAMVNGASKTLLYEFNVTGIAGQPKLETVPSPLLTEGVAKVFGGMLKGEKLGEPMDGDGGGERQK